MLHEFAYSSPRSTECWSSGGSEAANKPAFYLSTEALAKQVGHFDEEGSFVAAQPGLELAGEGTEAGLFKVIF